MVEKLQYDALFVAVGGSRKRRSDWAAENEKRILGGKTNKLEDPEVDLRRLRCEE